MTNFISPGRLLRLALAAEKPLQVAGVINAYAALLAEQTGFRALYLSGAGVANCSDGRQLTKGDNSSNQLAPTNARGGPIRKRM